jgi:hypothetical protein
MDDTRAPDDGRKVDLRELTSGVLLILVAAAFATSALRNLSLGSAGSMGPGYFPLMVTVPLAAIGLIIAARAFGHADTPQPMIRPLAFVLVSAAPIAFALTIKGLGLLGAVALTVLVSAWASKAMTVRTALLATTVLAALCVVIFYYLLRIPVSLIGPWLMP